MVKITPLLKPISSDDVAWTEWSDVPRFAIRCRHLSLATLGEDYRVGVAIEELAPGKQSSPVHYHIFEEEHVFILEGALTVRIGSSTHEMKAGDYVCFPAGQKAGHCLINTSAALCRYVIIGERNPNEVVVYTDSNKVLVRALGRRAIFDMDAVRNYWDGEDVGDALPEPADMSWRTSEANPGRPISAHDLDWSVEREWSRIGGSVKHLTHAAVGQDYHVGVIIESPAPGKHLAPMHYHMVEEEQALVLEGEITLFLGDTSYIMKPGDYACFPAGAKVAHSFMNSGSGRSSYLMIGEQNRSEVCVYPDSNKVMVRALRSERDIFDMAAWKNYWDGE
jgi:uncharacterized cupin superfamily protein